jgi:hypothetical protein
MSAAEIRIAHGEVRDALDSVRRALVNVGLAQMHRGTCEASVGEYVLEVLSELASATDLLEHAIRRFEEDDSGPEDDPDFDRKIVAAMGFDPDKEVPSDDEIRAIRDRATALASSRPGAP